MTCHTCRRYELEIVKDVTHGSNTNKIMILNLKRIKFTCIRNVICKRYEKKGLKIEQTKRIV